jgi:hypothetical protein
LSCQWLRIENETGEAGCTESRCVRSLVLVLVEDGVEVGVEVEVEVEVVVVAREVAWLDRLRILHTRDVT